jgi:hypothetical protein|tara:strand:- start:12637 stop:13116 length:480 start_codon:yes stop_codon:yes gene_type:complete
MEKRIRIHLGAGDKYWPGWINVDRHGDQDINADVCGLGKVDFADEIQAIHLFEHLPRLEIHKILEIWFDTLKEGGKLVLEMPCMNKIAKSIVDGEKNLKLTLLGIFGDPRDTKPDMMHQWCWTVDELQQELQNAGFRDIKFSDPRFHMVARDMRVTAFK